MNEEEENARIEQLLELENTRNKTEAWTKLNKTLKIQKLHAFAERHGKDKKYSSKEVKQLKHYFNEALEKKKLLKTKEVNYDKNKQEVTDVPGLLFNSATHTFTIRSDSKRVSTLRGLTPKSVTKKVKAPINLNTIDDNTIEKVSEENGHS